MNNRVTTILKWLLVCSLMVSLLSACGAPSVSEQYPLESVNNDGSQTSYVYRAAGETVPEVAAKLADQRRPQQMSPENNERMFLVYDDLWYHLQQDSGNPEDTLIEVDSREYVQRNYDPSFLEGYLTAALIGSLFDTIGSYGDYKGYNQRDVYKPRGSYHPPSASEKKSIPPITVDGKGSITKRSSKTDVSKSSGSGWFSKGSGSSGSYSGGSSGKITRSKDGAGSTSSGSWYTPRKSKAPKTSKSFGKIRRRK
ncbi:DUF4247 domain-containing protein [Paenibacillus beijingensis]|uniref:Lipoprotein n=1 Tax=Paenibacillus beijingensis TaxID=1126833 RepID=A0A0D5NDW4_9BACL|nr:DUF4247 domain-containing protein [Paenibacillus beijingensis]AJY73340.1 lipoprotein [Paenibacillus beijingensis]